MKQTDLKVNAQRQTMKTLGVPLWVQWGVSGRHGGVSPAGTAGVPSGVSVQTVPGPGLPSPALCAALSVRSFHYLTGLHVLHAPSVTLTAHLGSPLPSPEADCWSLDEDSGSPKMTR